MVIGFEQRRRSLACCRCQNRCVHQQEPMLIQPVTDRLDDRGPYAQGSPLPRRANPQVAVLHQEIDPMFLGCDWVLVTDNLDAGQVGDTELKAARYARGALIGAHLSGDDHRGFLG